METIIETETRQTSKVIAECQICGSKNLRSILFVGYIPPVNTMQKIGTPPVEQKTYPLELLRCDSCSLVQIGLEVDPNILFPPEYPYLSGSTRILRDNFVDLYNESSKILGLTSSDLIVDIGSNDGTLLAPFQKGGLRVLGVEPSRAAEVANARGIPTRMSFFNADAAREVKEKYGAARVVTAANVFAHIGGVHQIVDSILDLLTPNGVFISESHYLLDLIQTVQYDTIYHEHLRYYALGSLQVLLQGHGLEIFHVKRIPTHGGSIRVYAARKGQQKINPIVTDLLQAEGAAGITNDTAFQSFREKVVVSKRDFYALLAGLPNKAKPILGIGAPSRASTLINYLGIDDGVVPYVLEVSTSHKIGKYIPGTRIPVVDESKLFEEKPEYVLLFSWHIAQELMTNLRRKGYSGKFIVPLPTPQILDP